MKKINAALALIFLSANLYANSVNDMNKRLKNIDKEIEKKYSDKEYKYRDS